MNIDLKLNQASPTLFDMLNIPVQQRDDPFVSLKKACFPYRVFDAIVDSSTDNDIYVREMVLSKLKQAQTVLNTLTDYETCKLEVTYGYRSPEIQHKNYIEQLERYFDENKDAQSIMELANIYIACPHTAGHPSGAAIDLWITDSSGQALDFASDMHDLNEDSSIFNREISDISYKNRLALRTCMMAAGFAPYNGEWWHFSYGDREHAHWTGSKEAFFAPHSFDSEKKIFSEWSENNFNYINFLQGMCDKARAHRLKCAE